MPGMPGWVRLEEGAQPRRSQTADIAPRWQEWPRQRKTIQVHVVKAAVDGVATVHVVGKAERIGAVHSERIRSDRDGKWHASAGAEYPAEFPTARGPAQDSGSSLGLGISQVVAEDDIVGLVEVRRSASKPRIEEEHDWRGHCEIDPHRLTPKRYQWFFPTCRKPAPRDRGSVSSGPGLPERERWQSEFQNVAGTRPKVGVESVGCKVLGPARITFRRLRHGEHDRGIIRLHEVMHGTGTNVGDHPRGVGS